MPEHLRALVFLLFLGGVVWTIAGRKRVGLPIAPEDFSRRRNLWFAATALAFLAHDFWIFMAVLALTVGLSARSERNPIALFLVIALAIPPFFREIPGALGIDHIIALDVPRLLALVLLLPAWFVLRARPDVQRFGTLWPDRLLAAYLVLYFAAQVPYDSLTNSVRLGLVYPFLEVFLPYYVASRTLRSVKAFKDVVATFAVTAMALGLIAAFESLRGWLLYSALNEALGIPWHLSNYLMRGEGGRLRAQASLGHSIVLGYTLVVALILFALLRPEMSAPRVVNDGPTNRASTNFGGRFGTSLVGALLAVPLALLAFLRPSSYVPGRPAPIATPTRFPSMAWRAGALVILVGLIASLSRGPWVGAVAGLLVLAATGPQVMSRLLKLSTGGVLAIGALMTTEAGRRIVEFLPFVGSVDNMNVSYRQRLFDVSIDVILQRPLFGAYDFMRNPLLEQMRQGEGIIDIVNSYLGVAMRNGLVGLALFLGVFLVIGWGLVQCLRRIEDKDSEDHLLGRVLLAALAAVMVTIATVSSILTVPLLYWSLLGMAVAYRQMMLARLPAVQRMPSARYARR